MKILPQRKAFALIVLAEVNTRRGAAVSINVRAQDATEEELGPRILIEHEPRKHRDKRLTPALDQDIVAMLLEKVHETMPRAKMEWDDDATGWFIFVPRERKTPVTNKP